VRPYLKNKLKQKGLGAWVGGRALGETLSSNVNTAPKALKYHQT
jgi:hypothetical protein